MQSTAVIWIIALVSFFAGILAVLQDHYRRLFLVMSIVGVSTVLMTSLRA